MKMAWSDLSVRSVDLAKPRRREPSHWSIARELRSGSNPVSLLTFAGLPTNAAPKELGERESLIAIRRLLTRRT